MGKKADKLFSTRRASGGLSLALRRKKGSARIAQTAEVVPYEGEDTPVADIIKAAGPTKQSFRGGEYLHVSDVIGKCVRQLAILDRMGMPRPIESIFDSLGLTFAIGDAVHTYLTSRITEASHGAVWAEWRCMCGKTKERGLFRDIGDAECEECHTPLTQHHEIAYPWKEYGVTGSPDVLLYMDMLKAIHIVELKSIAKSTWDDLARPLPDHKVQVSFYWHILRAAGVTITDHVSVFYACKENMMKNPYKEFCFEPYTVLELEPWLADLRAFKTAKAGGPLPPVTVCEDINGRMAKKCPVRVLSHELWKDGQ